MRASTRFAPRFGRPGLRPALLSVLFTPPLGRTLGAGRVLGVLDTEPGRDVPEGRATVGRETEGRGVTREPVLGRTLGVRPSGRLLPSDGRPVEGCDTDGRDVVGRETDGRETDGRDTPGLLTWGLDVTLRRGAAGCEVAGREL